MANEDRIEQKLTEAQQEVDEICSRLPNTPAPQGRCADHCVGEACPETDCPVKPVEQGEQTLDKDCKCCGYACRGFLCDYCFRERLIDSFHQCKKCKTKPSTTAPSQPELPLIATVESWIEDRTKAVTWGTNNGSSWLGVLTGDLQIILDSLRTIAQLQERCDRRFHQLADMATIEELQQRKIENLERTIAQLRQDIEKGIEDEVQFRSQIMLMLDKVGIPTTKTDSDKHSRFLTTRLRIEKLITMYAAKDARIAKLEKDREIPWTDKQ